MLGIQVPRSLPDPSLPLTPPRSLDQRIPPSRERLGLRSLSPSVRTPSSRSASQRSFPRGDSMSLEMNGTYGSAQQPASHYASGTYGSAMSGISSQKTLSNPSSWQSHHPRTSYQASQPSQTSLPASQVQSRAASPEFETQPSYNSESNSSSKHSSNNAIHPYLQLPPTISASGGSISEFAAKTTCLFWFESSPTLLQIEDMSRQIPPRSVMVPDAWPSTGFTKWVTTILSTTQVTQNVILLALLFIRRLKKQNPTVRGKVGSEYRLLTVALMLGNKFLDDNTYTNKTWAEVSGISVSEIHVMEVEFLSHMKYNLYTSKQEWMNWHKQLAHLWNFYNMDAPRLTDLYSRSQQSYKPPMLQIPKTLPSPPSSNNASSPPYPMSVSPGFPPYTNGVPSLPQPIPTQISPSNSMPSLDHPFPRKRSCDESIHSVEPPPKRKFTSDAFHASRSSTPVQALPPHTGASQLANLPVPHLPFPGQPGRPHAYRNSATPVSNNMTPNSTSNWIQPMQSQPADGRSLPALHVATGGHPDRSRHHTPMSSLSRHASPIAPNYATSTAAHSSAHNQLSPSVFLHQRSSPYRPVRNISTLLVPPPSGQIRNIPQSIPDEQMYWHPLGRQTVRKTGRVPYDHHGAWPETHQYQHWHNNYPPISRV